MLNLFGMKGVSGAVPIPLGKITVKFEKVNGKIKGVIKNRKKCFSIVRLQEIAR